MTWLTPDPGEHPAKRLRGMLDGEGVIVVPGCSTVSPRCSRNGPVPR